MKKLIIVLLFGLITSSAFSQVFSVNDTTIIYGRKYIEKTIFINDSICLKMFKSVGSYRFDSIKTIHDPKLIKAKYDSIFQKEMKKLEAINEDN